MNEMAFLVHVEPRSLAGDEWGWGEVANDPYSRNPRYSEEFTVYGWS